MSDVTTGKFINSKPMTDNINMEPTGSQPGLAWDGWLYNDIEHFLIGLSRDIVTTLEILNTNYILIAVITTKYLKVKTLRAYHNVL